MSEELAVLQTVSQRLEAAHIPFMLTGSFAMAYYGQPRMTRDLDLVDRWAQRLGVVKILEEITA